jgi:cupin fold WbuC family metalloprotein
MSQPRLIDAALFDTVSAEARASSRRRRNRNFHPDDTAACHRLLNAMEPDSYIQPHRHQDPAKGESIIVLRGRIGAVFFDDQGEVVSHAMLEPGGAVVGINAPPGVYHTLLALVPGTVFFESKAGPYLPLTSDEKAPWAPAEGEAEASPYLQRLRGLFCP